MYNLQSLDVITSADSWSSGLHHLVADYIVSMVVVIVGHLGLESGHHSEYASDIITHVEPSHIDRDVTDSCDLQRPTMHDQ